MDPLTAALMFGIEAIKARQQWWDSLPQETKADLAERYAQGEIRLLDFLDKIWGLIDQKNKKPQAAPKAQRRKK